MGARQEKIRKVLDQRQEGVIVLEDIHDPHNAAAVMRSADAFGFQKIYFIFDQEKPFDPVRKGKASSASANKWLSFKIFRSGQECFAELKRDGFQIWATVVDRQATSIFDSKFQQKKLALVFGNEHRGLSAAAVNSADQKIYIPMLGMVQSLNLSVSASILMYEITRQRLGKAGDFRLNEKELGRLKNGFLKE